MGCGFEDGVFDVVFAFGHLEDCCRTTRRQSSRYSTSDIRSYDVEDNVQCKSLKLQGEEQKVQMHVDFI